MIFKKKLMSLVPPSSIKLVSTANTLHEAIRSNMLIPVQYFPGGSQASSPQTFQPNGFEWVLISGIRGMDALSASATEEYHLPSLLTLVVIRTDSLPLVSHEKKRNGQSCTTRFLKEIHTLTTHLVPRLAEDGGELTGPFIKDPAQHLIQAFHPIGTLSSFFLSAWIFFFFLFYLSQ